MSDAEILGRIDQHMARGNEHMARGNEHMTRGNELMAEIRSELAKNREERREFRQFLRDMTRHNELVMGRLATEIRGLEAQTAAGTQVLVDLHEESQAQRGAILALIDELRRNGLGRRD